MIREDKMYYDIIFFFKQKTAYDIQYGLVGSEMCIRDSGSTDQSKFLCEAIDKKYKQVKFYDFKQNKGLGRVLNFAISKAKGKYIARINQDDLMLSLIHI